LAAKAGFQVFDLALRRLESCPEAIQLPIHFFDGNALLFDD
jgi:hypothetical protein